MIEFYRPADDCSNCTDIEAALEEMVIAHKIITVNHVQKAEALPPGTPLPALKDNDKFITGHNAITAHIKELEKFVETWRKFQSDACYIDDNGEAC